MARRAFDAAGFGHRLQPEEKLAPATVSSWESRRSPKLPPDHRLRAYARFFATQRSIEAGLKLLTFEELTPDEQAVYQKLEDGTAQPQECGGRGVRRRRDSVQQILAFC